MYILRINTDKDSYVKKFTKTRDHDNRSKMKLLTPFCALCSEKNEKITFGLLAKRKYCYFWGLKILSLEVDFVTFSNASS